LEDRNCRNQATCGGAGAGLIQGWMVVACWLFHLWSVYLRIYLGWY
jgi:hypothetical protein